MTLKIEVGKSYRTAKGVRVDITEKSGPSYVGRFDGMKYFWEASGLFLRSDFSPDSHPKDLVAEWDDPPSSEPTPFRITGPGFYRQRDGSTAEVVGQASDGHWIGIRSDDILCSWCAATGTCVSGGGDAFDLVAPWTEPRTWEIDVVITDGPAGVTRFIEDASDNPDNVAVVARKRVTVIEGEGL